MATVTTSSLFNLDWKDALKGAIISAITGPITIILESLNAGTFKIDWTHVGTVALAAFLSYILKKFLSPAEIKITDIDKETVKAVKEGGATAVVMSTNSAA